MTKTKNGIKNVKKKLFFISFNEERKKLKFTSPQFCIILDSTYNYSCWKNISYFFNQVIECIQIIHQIIYEISKHYWLNKQITTQCSYYHYQNHF